MNISFLGYTETQCIMIKYLKKKICGDLTLMNKNKVFEKMNKIYRVKIVIIWKI